MSSKMNKFEHVWGAGVRALYRVPPSHKTENINLLQLRQRAGSKKVIY